MPDLITKEFRLHNAEQFLEQFSESTPDNIYLYIGKPRPWPDDNNPPTLSQTMNEIYYNPYETMVAMKRIVSSDVSYSVPRYNWTSGTVYGQYNSATDYFSSQFYVMTDEYKVYKCLGNNKGATSVNKPTSTSTSKFTTADGYVWKYMYTLQASDAVKFLTSDYIPVRTLTSDDGSLQWDVQAAAVKGTIDLVGITAGGSSYLYNTNNVVSSTTNTVVLHSSASSSNSVYNNYAIYIVSGTGAGQIRTISSYVGSTRTATLSANWSTNPDATSVYVVSPRVVATGNGTGFSAYTVVTAGAISNVVILNSGINYSQIALSVVGQTGSGASIYGSLPPVKGHGKDAREELYGHNVTINLRMTGAEANLITVGNDFRIVGLVANPKLAANTSAQANALIYDMTTKFTVSGAVGTFLTDEVLTGQTSGSTAVVVKNESSTLLSVNAVNGAFLDDEVIQGGTSGATATLTDVTFPLVDKYSGKILYVRNQSPVYRSTDQTEDYRITVKF